MTATMSPSATASAATAARKPDATSGGSSCDGLTFSSVVTGGTLSVRAMSICETFCTTSAGSDCASMAASFLPARALCARHCCTAKTSAAHSFSSWSGNASATEGRLESESSRSCAIQGNLWWYSARSATASGL